MLLRLNEDPKIEDLRNHPAESVETLRALLRTGVPARPDPRRRAFYEVDNCSRVFYIHITPRGRVLLLAIWPKETPEPKVEAERRAAVSPCGAEAWADANLQL
jgi:MoaA/NifB/PqqE/SkfB family radical SAM enzyme